MTCKWCWGFRHLGRQKQDREEPFHCSASFGSNWSRVSWAISWVFSTRATFWYLEANEGAAAHSYHQGLYMWDSWDLPGLEKFQMNLRCWGSGNTGKVHQTELQLQYLTARCPNSPSPNLLFLGANLRTTLQTAQKPFGVSTQDVSLL